MSLDYTGRPNPDVPRLLKAISNVFVAVEQHLDGPVDLTHKATAQTSIYTHTDVRTAEPSMFDPGRNS
jgi:hypothetical protein